MAMATLSNSTKEFLLWLQKKLIDLNTDDEVFSPYIIGILETEDNDEEKRDSLLGILSEITENTSDLCSEILEKWSETLEKDLKEKEKNAVKVNVDEKLAKLMEESKLKPLQLQVVSTTSEQKELKEAILAQYSQVSDGELSEEVEDEAPRMSSMGLMKNTNVECVAKAEREKREREKEESHRKKEKDKEDRAKQKAKDEERREKEKRRTQKQDRRR